MWIHNYIWVGLASGIPINNLRAGFELVVSRSTTCDYIYIVMWIHNYIWVGLASGIPINNLRAGFEPVVSRSTTCGWYVGHIQKTPECSTECHDQQLAIQNWNRDSGIRTDDRHWKVTGDIASTTAVTFQWRTNYHWLTVLNFAGQSYNSLWWQLPYWVSSARRLPTSAILASSRGTIDYW